MIDDPTIGKSILVTDRDPGVNLPYFLAAPSEKKL
jgi:hypothetical protein